MLDLNFVRDNLALVEEKLRQRGMNPSEALKDFQSIDAERRLAITQMENLKAKRNQASDEIAKAKKSGQDASAQIHATKEMREQMTFVFATEIRQVLDAALEPVSGLDEKSAARSNGTARPRKRKGEKAAAKV